MSRVVGPSMFCPTLSPRCIATLYSQTHPPTAVSTAALCVCVHALRYRYLCRGAHSATVHTTLPRYTPQERTGFTGELYVDTTTTGDGALSQPQSQAYAALRLKRGASILSKATGEMFAGLQEQGYTQKHGPLLRDFEGSKEDIMVTIWPGDVFQVGGMFVLGPGNTCDYAYRSKFAGDHSNILDVLQAATGMPLAPVFSAPSASSASSASSAPRPLSGGAHGGRGGGCRACRSYAKMMERRGRREWMWSERTHDRVWGGEVVGAVVGEARLRRNSPPDLNTTGMVWWCAAAQSLKRTMVNCGCCGKEWKSC